MEIIVASKAARVPKKTKSQVRHERAQVQVPHPGLNFSSKHHVFIAKLKRGEIWALNQLEPVAKAAVSPLFEMWPPTQPLPPKSAKTLEQHTKDLMQYVADEWTGLPSYVDTRYLPSASTPVVAVKTVFDIARTLKLNVVPVTSPLFPQSYQQAIGAVAATDKRGVMVRLEESFFEDPHKVSGYLSGLLNVLGVQRDEVDILIDLEYCPKVLRVHQLGAYCLNTLPAVEDWRTVTIASGCFPPTISSEPHGSWIQHDRSDWAGWRRIARDRKLAGKRVPSYGDYGVRCGGEPLVIPQSPDPNIRYSDERHVWVRREHKEQYSMAKICADLSKKPYFRGQTFSKGDAEITARAATNNPSNAQAEQWIQWCTNHHLELTAGQIRSLP